ncbi:MarR family transcriptional regulator [Brevibacillus sp. B_LB10_24]|uniref:MarR family transcriptional regulator n=1 Tax=Brevibacillus sp. B_LB10_24 TaxID=3380645 RepID=UPI0038B7B888
MGKAAIIRDLLRNLNKLMGLIVSKELAEFGLTMPQMMVLRCVMNERKTIGQISCEVQLSYSTVSGIIDRLERDNFVQRSRDHEDRRVVWITKTDKFAQIKKQVPLFQEEYYSQMLLGLTDSQLDNTITTLQMLTIQLEKKVEEKP